MNRRSFMALLGLAPVVAPMAAQAVVAIDDDSYIDAAWLQQIESNPRATIGGIDRAANDYWRTISYEDVIATPNALLANLKKANRVG